MQEGQLLLLSLAEEDRHQDDDAADNSLIVRTTLSQGPVLPAVYETPVAAAADLF